jgi:DNA-binding response OmpR family regulator
MRVLLIDKDGDLLDQVVGDIQESYIVDTAGSGVEGTYLSETNEYDAVVVGPSLTDMNPCEVCQKARNANLKVPIVYIPTENKLESRLEAYKSGADVCINRPVNGEELKAQLRAFERLKAGVESSEIKIKNFSLNLITRSVCFHGKKLDLRRKEFDILEYLFINKNRVVSKEELLDHVWENGIYIFSNTLEVHIRNIRNRLEKPNKITLIKTVRGFGYTI